MKYLFLLALVTMTTPKTFAEPMTALKAKLDVIGFDDKNVKVKQNGKVFFIPRSAVKNSPLVAGKNQELVIDKESFAKLKTSQNPMK